MQPGPSPAPQPACFGRNCDRTRDGRATFQMGGPVAARDPQQLFNRLPRTGRSSSVAAAQPNRKPQAPGFKI